MCVCVCAAVFVNCVCLLSTFSVCLCFRKRSCKPVWSYLGISWATISAVQKTFPTAVRFITEWLTQALLFSPLNFYRPSYPLKRCVLQKEKLSQWFNSTEVENYSPIHLPQASENLPENMGKAIFNLSLDTSLGSLLPSMQETAVAYLELVNSDSYDLYRKVARAALWMESTCNFLKEAQAEVWNLCFIVTASQGEGRIRYVFTCYISKIKKIFCQVDFFFYKSWMYCFI